MSEKDIPNHNSEENEDLNGDLEMEMEGLNEICDKEGDVMDGVEISVEVVAPLEDLEKGIWRSPRKLIVHGAQEMKVMSLVALPIILALLVNYMFSLVSVIAVGHLGDAELGAATLAAMFCNITGFSVIIGMMSAQDTLSTQAYGAGELLRVGVVLQRSVAIGAVLGVLIGTVWALSGPILLVLGQDEEVVGIAAVMIRVMISSLPAQIVFEALRRYLQVQSITVPIFFCSLASLVCMVVLSVFLVYVLDIGYIGAPLAYSASLTIQALLMVAYLFISGDHRDTWPGFTADAFRGWVEYLRTGVPTTIMGALEWWAFEIQAIFAGWISIVQLDTHALLFQTGALFFMVPLGISLAVATRVGNLLGAGSPRRARLAAMTAIAMTATSQASMALLLLCLRDVWPRLFSSSDDVVNLTSQVLPVLCSFMIFDGLAGGTCSGIVRGCGLVTIGACINFVVYYLFCIPVGAALAFWAGWGVFGMWTGLALATISCFTLYFILLNAVSWTWLSHRAISQARIDGQADNIPEQADNLM